MVVKTMIAVACKSRVTLIIIPAFTPRKMLTVGAASSAAAAATLSALGFFSLDFSVSLSNTFLGTSQQFLFGDSTALKCSLYIGIGRFCIRIGKTSNDFIRKLHEILPPYKRIYLFLRVTSWAPPSTMETAETRVSFASLCRSGMVVTPTLHMVDLTLYREASTLSCRGPA